MTAEGSAEPLPRTIARAKTEAFAEAARLALETGGYLPTAPAEVRTAIAKRLRERSAEYANGIDK